MQANSAICFIVERLRASALGAYGNTWFETRGLDRLASESLTLDHATIDAPDLSSLYRSYWQALHAMRPAKAGINLTSLPELVARKGHVTALITDRAEVADHALAAPFNECLRVESAVCRRPVQHTHQTQLARLMAVASDWLEQHARQTAAPFLLWIHSRGMAGPWDAPLPLRNRLADAEDPRPPARTDPPCYVLPPGYDPDEVFGAACAYAGQVIVLDDCVDALLTQLPEHPLGKATLLVLLGANGFPLGEHGQIGPVEDTLYGETIHVPWLIRLPDLSAAVVRTQTLAQPADLAATLADWFDVAVPDPRQDGQSLLLQARGAPNDGRDRALVVSTNGERALRTPAWLLRRVPAAPPELFVKPDDRWEVNDVAARCPEVASELAEAMDQLAGLLQSDQPADLAPLPPHLLTGP